MCVRERLLTGILKVQIHETENIYNRQAQLDKADVEICRRLSGFNFRRRAFPPFSAKATIIFPTLKNIHDGVIRVINFNCKYIRDAKFLALH